MSGSQEAASALHIMQEELDRINMELAQNREQMARHQNDLDLALHHAQQANEALTRLNTTRARLALRAGELTGAIAAFNGPRGYGGAPVLRSGQASDRLYRTPVRRVR